MVRVEAENYTEADKVPYAHLATPGEPWSTTVLRALEDLGYKDQAAQRLMKGGRRDSTLSATARIWSKWSSWCRVTKKWCPTFGAASRSIKTADALSFLAQVTLENNEPPAFGYWRAFKAAVVNSLRLCGSLKDWSSDHARLAFENLRNDARKTNPDRPRYDSFFNVDDLSGWLVEVFAAKPTDSADILRKEVRRRFCLLAKMHALLRTDDLAKIETGSLLKPLGSQDPKSSHWVLQDEVTSTKRAIKARKNPELISPALLSPPSLLSFSSVMAVVFFIPGAKTDSPAIRIDVLRDDPALCCAFAAFQWRTQRLGPEMSKATAADCSKFLCSNNRQRGSFNSVGKETLSKDIVSCMTEAGIDVSIFKAHSIRGAAASKMRDEGASVDDILRLGRWSSSSVFNTFYNRAKGIQAGKLGALAVSRRPVDLPPDTNAHKRLASAPSTPQKPASQRKRNSSISVKGVNMSRPIPEAYLDGNNALRHCFACNKADSRMIHCSVCNVHLHREHFGDCSDDYVQAETLFYKDGFTCLEGCPVVTSWSSWNLAADSPFKSALEIEKLWRVGGISAVSKSKFLSIIGD